MVCYNQIEAAVSKREGSGVAFFYFDGYIRMTLALAIG